MDARRLLAAEPRCVSIGGITVKTPTSRLIRSEFPLTEASYGGFAIIHFMQHFPTIRDLAQAFIKSYFATLTDQPSNLPKFYLPDALVARNGSPARKFTDLRPSDLFLPLQSDSILEVLHYSVLPVCPEHLLLTVAGQITEDEESTGFTRTFILKDFEGTVWISSDTIQILGRKLRPEADRPDDVPDQRDEDPIPEPPEQKPATPRAQKSKKGKNGRKP
jgi:hypothetical protein